MNHLPDSKYLETLHGFQIDSFLIALEGYRRGLNLKFYKRRDGDTYFPESTIPNEFPGVIFSLDDGVKKHYFYRTRGDKTSQEVIDCLADKMRFKTHMQTHGLNTPKGASFNIDNIVEIMEYAKTLKFPIVIKPTFGSMGRGVYSNINSLDKVKYVLVELRERYTDYKEIIVEEYFNGDDYRFYVVDDEVIAIYTRHRAHVVGNGKDTIGHLIDKKNDLKKENPNTYNKPIKIDESLLQQLGEQNVNLDSIPEVGETIILREVPNISLGGDPADVTETISKELKKEIVKAVKSFGDLPNAGVDVLIDGDTFTIIEMNSVAVITSHVYPVDGIVRDVPKAILDFYFPDSKRITDENVQFDYKAVIAALSEGTMREVTIDNILSRAAVKAYRVIFDSDVSWIDTGKLQSFLQYREWYGTIRGVERYELEIFSYQDIQGLIEDLKLRFLISEVDVNEISKPSMLLMSVNIE